MDIIDQLYGKNESIYDSLDIFTGAQPETYKTNGKDLEGTSVVKKEYPNKFLSSVSKMTKDFQTNTIFLSKDTNGHIHSYAFDIILGLTRDNVDIPKTKIKEFNDEYIIDMKTLNRISPHLEGGKIYELTTKKYCKNKKCNSTSELKIDDEKGKIKVYKSKGKRNDNTENLLEDEEEKFEQRGPIQIELIRAFGGKTITKLKKKTGTKTKSKAKTKTKSKKVTGTKTKSKTATKTKIKTKTKGSKNPKEIAKLKEKAKEKLKEDCAEPKDDDMKLYCEIQKGKDKKIEKMMKNVNPNYYYQLGSNPIYSLLDKAVMNKQVSIVKSLLKHGADPNLANNFQNLTPLLLIMRYRYMMPNKPTAIEEKKIIDIVKSLIEKGAKSDIKDPKGFDSKYYSKLISKFKDCKYYEKIIK